MEIVEYRKRRAKKGFAAKKKELLDKLTIVHGSYQLSVIRCLNPKTCPKEWIDQKDANFQAMNKLKEELEGILV